MLIGSVKFLRENSAFRILLGAMLVSLAGAPQAIVGPYYGIYGPLVNIDFVIATIAYCFFPLVGIILFLISAASIALSSIGTIFRFNDIFILIEASQFVRELRPEVLWGELTVSITACLAASGLLCVLGLTLVRIDRKIAWWGGVFLCFASVVDIVNGSSSLIRTDLNYLRINVVGSPAFHVYRNAFNRNSDSKDTTNADSVIDKFNVLEWAEDNQSRSIALFIIESMGEPRSQRVRAWLDSILWLDGSDTLRFSITSRGATTSGELRTLCGLESSWSDILLRERSIKEDKCIPKRLTTMGWATFGIHGFKKEMFARYRWWSQIGLETNLFIEDLKLSSKDICFGAYTAACDSFVIDQGINKLDRPRRFVYVLTIDTHLPARSFVVSKELSKLCAEESISHAVCNQLAGVEQALRYLLSRIRTLDQRPLVLVVGDHPPPFFRYDDNKQFMGERTPAYILVPNQAHPRRARD